MANTTVDNVLAIAPELIDVSQEAWDLILSDVAATVTEAVYGTKQETAQRYLAAHMLSMIARQDKGGAIISEKTGDVSTSYGSGSAKDDLDETIYGRQFKRIRSGTVAGFMTVTP